MAQTSWGFDGTINEAQWAQMAGLLGNGYCVADNNSLAVAPVSGARQVTVAAGTAYGDGVVTVLDASETVNLATPTNGQWYVIALRRVWATNTTSLVAVAGATTTTTTPTFPPSTLPTLSTTVGVQTDQPIAWAWANSANTTVVVSDLRQLPVRTVIQQPNVIMNGAFEINQRSFTTTSTTATYGFDRWLFNFTTGSATYSAQTLPSGAIAGAVSSQFARVVSSSQTATTGFTSLSQRIEDVRTLAGKTVTVSFWAKTSSANPSVSVEWVQNFGTGGSATVTGSVAAGTVKKLVISGGAVWSRYQATLTIPSIDGKTVGTSSYVELVLWTSAGSNFATRTDTLGVQTATVDFWGVQVEEGAFATPFRRAGASYAEELAMCQRYYIRFLTDPGFTAFGLMCMINTTTGVAHVPFPVTMRAIPTLDATAANTFNLSGSSDIALATFALRAETSRSHGVLTATVATAQTSGATFRLTSNNSSTKLGFDAEL